MEIHPALGVIWDACRQPEGGGLGYVFAFTGRRTGRILAWLDRRGRAYACDAPLTELPEGDPDVLLARWADDENAGGTVGNIISIIYKGDHYQVIVRTEENEEDFVLDTEDLWNENDYVGVKIAPDKIRMTLKQENK